MQFPNSGTGRPYIRLDARTATFKASCLDSDAAEVDLTGKILDLDLTNAEQGWLKVDQQGADFLPLAKRDDWNGTPSPSPEYSPAVSLDLRSEAWGEPAVRELRGGSRAITSFIASVAKEAGEIPNGKAVRVRILAVDTVKFGRGTSTEIRFEIAPKSKWPDLSTFGSDGGSSRTDPEHADDDTEQPDAWA